jgi:hypothetical protein
MKKEAGMKSNFEFMVERKKRKLCQQLEELEFLTDPDMEIERFRTLNKEERNVLQAFGITERTINLKAEKIYNKLRK